MYRELFSGSGGSYLYNGSLVVTENTIGTYRYNSSLYVNARVGQYFDFTITIPATLPVGKVVYSANSNATLPLTGSRTVAKALANCYTIKSASLSVLNVPDFYSIELNSDFGIDCAVLRLFKHSDVSTDIIITGRITITEVEQYDGSTNPAQSINGNIPDLATLSWGFYAYTVPNSLLNLYG